MEYYECLNILKDTENALFRECEKIVKLEAELARKDEEIDRLREALEFYENRDNYTKPSPESDYGFTPIEKDVGAKAREALQRSTG